MKKFFMAALIIWTFFLAGCDGENIKTEGNNTFNEVTKLVIGIDDEFAPISFHNEKNELVGFDVDLAKEAASRLGVEIEFKPIEWDKKREEITSGNIDLIWNGLDITEERKEYMIFTKPYMDDRQVMLVNKGNGQDIHSEGDLEGKVVGVQAGSTSDDYFIREEILRGTFKEYKTYIYFADLVSALRSDEIDVLVCDELIARYVANKSFGKFDLVNVSIGTIAEMAVGFRKEDTELRDKVQKVFEDMIRDGTAKAISEKWFNADLIKRKR